MNRKQLERNYWEAAATHPDVERKFISSSSTALCKKELMGEPTGKFIGRVLEIGCGIGRMMEEGYHGIDISDKMIRLAKNNKPGCGFYVSDGREIPFEDSYFDVIYSILVFQHIPFSGFESYVKEVARTLKDNGRFIFQFVEGDEDEPFSKHYSVEKVKQVLESNDLTIKREWNSDLNEQWRWIRVEKAVSKPSKK